MAGAGYDPWALPRYIGRVQPPDPDPPKVFSPLPRLATRLEGLASRIHELPRFDFSINNDQFLSIQQEIRFLPGYQPLRAPTLRRNPAKRQP